MGELKSAALAIALAIVSALIMLVLGILARVGIYTGAAEMMMQWHMFYSLTIPGIIAGMVEAGIISFIFGYIFAVLYNKMT
ncbi:ABC-type antimicrobial peptide transport system permease subunit [Methanohalophilus levihalophilus]|uniref:hypothetical protein n=1 Tax=Methanohalophilus levihalophilus TaxID=1431282 RepID=UPI001AE685A4|nr:hypothetical protein [Methanohalophilus levihalophilus]MBP2030801.1 ABC-type antimicrobial peptide transport system permease subunit [Methanohalophilus levihalophilus]